MNRKGTTSREILCLVVVCGARVSLWAGLSCGRIFQNTASAYALVATAAYRRLSRQAPFVKT